MIGQRSAGLVSSALRSVGSFTHAECSLNVAKRSISLSAVCSKQPSKVNKQQQQATSASTSATPAAAAASGSKDASSCVAGTVLTGLNIYKDRADPVALPDAEYPPWLWTLLDEGNVTSDGVQLESTDGLTKGQARIVEKRNLRLIRAAFRAKERAAARAAAQAAEAGDSAAGVVVGAVGKAEASAADAQATVAVDRAAEEREKKRQLRKANREGIKAKNFVKSN